MSILHEKIKRLERYLAAEDADTDRVVEQTVDKLLERETARLTKLKTHLEQQLKDYEKQYAIESAQFHARFERGEMGDGTDFVEWSATYEMLEGLNRRLALLLSEAT